MDREGHAALPVATAIGYPEHNSDPPTRAREEPAMTVIQGLFETHLTVRDLERSLAFYRDRLGLTVAHRVPPRNAAFLWLGAPGRAMLGLWGVGSAPLGLQLHLAFAVCLDDVVAAPARLRQQGITPLSFSGEPTDEPVVLGWMPAAAVYFNDPDGHSLEYLAMLPEPAHPEAGAVPYRAWLARYGQPAGS
jgi:lactoylglutathione lyase